MVLIKKKNLFFTAFHCQNARKSAAKSMSEYGTICDFVVGECCVKLVKRVLATHKNTEECCLYWKWMQVNTVINGSQSLTLNPAVFPCTLTPLVFSIVLMQLNYPYNITSALYKY